MMSALAPDETEFVAWLGTALKRAPEAALDLILQAPEDPSMITTSIIDGSFRSLSLRAIGPRLRWERPVGPLSLPLSGLQVQELDVHGLGLTELTCGPALRRLDCSSNTLAQLDLSQAAGLEVLEVRANDLMLLDLRDHHALSKIDCSGNALSALILADDAPVRVIRANRNQLMVFDIGERSDLIELRLERNALVHLPLRAPNLRILSVQRNELTRLDLTHLGKLQSLDVRYNRLASLRPEACPALRSLFCSHNYLDTLDTQGLEQLEELVANGNQIQSVSMPPSNVLNRLELRDNRLSGFKLDHCPLLEVLDLSGNHLDELELAGAPSLTTLCARDNQIHHFDAAHTPRLVRLDLQNNPLKTVDLTDATTLTQVELDGNPTLKAPDRLVLQLPSLRRITHVPVHDDPKSMDRFELHHLAATYNAPDRDQLLLEVVKDDARCTRATAVLIYWSTHPHYYLQFAGREEVPSYALDGWDLLQAIEERIRTNAYMHDDVFFDPRADRTRDPNGKDWTAGSSYDTPRSIPAYMTRRCG